MLQRTEVWHKDRAGKVTASRISAVMAKDRAGNPGATRTNYMMDLLVQRLTGWPGRSFQTAQMVYGTEMEQMARGMYEGTTGLLIEEVGFIESPDFPGEAGASPDGLAAADGLVEFKCPNTAQHVDFLIRGIIPTQYEVQMLFQMQTTRRHWCDFASYDDDMPAELQFKCVRFPFNPVRAAAITLEVKKFLTELSTLEAEMRKLMEQS